MKQKRLRLARPKLVCALIFNCVLAPLCGYAVYDAADKLGCEALYLFPVASCAFTAVVSCLFVIFSARALKRGTPVAKAICVFRYMAAVCAVMTAAGTVALGYNEPGLFDAFLAFPRPVSHIAVPVLSVFSFIVFEKQNRLSFRHLWLALIPVSAYALTFTALNYFDLFAGPYAFFAVKTQPADSTALIYGVLAACAFVSAFLLYIPAKDKKQKLHL